MATVKHRLVQLLLDKDAKAGKRLSQSEHADRIGIPENTLSRWMRNNEIKRIDHDIVVKLCRYLECQIGDLLYIDWREGDAA